MSWRFAHDRDRNFCSVTSDMTQIAQLVCSMTILFTLGKSHWLRWELTLSTAALRNAQTSRQREIAPSHVVIALLKCAAVNAAAFKNYKKQAHSNCEDGSACSSKIGSRAHVNVCSLCAR